MDEREQQALGAMRAITISREYGSGGGEIAARLARRLGWRLVDHQIVVRAARELSIHESAIRAHDEHVEDILSRLMQWPYPTPATEVRAYHETLRRIVLEEAQSGHAVIVGRGGQVLLGERRDVLHVRIVAPLDLRVSYVVRREGLDRASARTRVQEKDRARARYMQTQFQSEHMDPHLYDLVVNTAVFDLDSVVELVRLALMDKAARLKVPTELLGPAGDVSLYPVQPSDVDSQ